VIICDTGPLVALLNKADNDHAVRRDAVERGGAINRSGDRERATDAEL
jgi:hypothetical protein